MDELLLTAAPQPPPRRAAGWSHRSAGLQPRPRLGTLSGAAAHLCWRSRRAAGHRGRGAGAGRRRGAEGCPWRHRPRRAEGSWTAPAQPGPRPGCGGGGGGGGGRRDGAAPPPAAPRPGPAPPLQHDVTDPAVMDGRRQPMHGARQPGAAGGRGQASRGGAARRGAAGVAAVYPPRCSPARGQALCPEMPPNLTGYYRFVSQENMDNYLRALDINVVLRKLVCLLKPDKEIIHTGDHMIIRTITSLRDYVMNFDLGVQFEEDLGPVDGRKCQTTVSWEGDQLVCEQLGEKRNRGWRHWLEGDQLHLRMTAEDEVCVQVFQKVK
uniref:Retinol binding protein 5 n=1 Tax=Dromaius novaehollandiae TaxID=8790 RepID=A0A8C4PDP4_DRONO